MRRILVPLDGSRLAESILPDARRLAGPAGTLILARNAGQVLDDDRAPQGAGGAAREAGEYLRTVAERLRLDGAPVHVELLTPNDVVWTVGEAASRLHADLIACAAHGQGPMGQLLHGSVAWRVLARSSIPVVLRHPGEREMGVGASRESGPRTILVPLDGSELAEVALPLAHELAGESQAAVRLVHVIPAGGGYYGYTGSGLAGAIARIEEAEAYLTKVAREFSGDVRTDVLHGPVAAGRLVEYVDTRGITDVVMTSHGRTGVARVLLGSVAHELIQRLRCPVVVIPPRAFPALRRSMAGRRTAANPGERELVLQR